MDTQLILALKNNKLLKNIDFSKINLEQVKGDLLTVQEGEIIYREGHASDSIFLVVSGEINLLKKKLLGKTKSIVFYDNDFFGYEEFVEGMKRTSTTVALRDSYIIKLSKKEIDNLCEQESTILDHLKDPSLTEDFDMTSDVTPEVEFENEPEEIKEEVTPEDFNISEEDFKIPDELQSTIDSAIANLDEEEISNVENEIESKLNDAVEENENVEEDFSLDEQAFAESLKEKEDDVFFNIDDLDSLEDNEQTEIKESGETQTEEPISEPEFEETQPEPEIDFNEPDEKLEDAPEDTFETPAAENNQEELVNEEPEEFSAQPYQAGAYQPPEAEEPAEENVEDDFAVENDFNFDESYAEGLSKEDEEFFANISESSSEQNFETPSTDQPENKNIIPQDDEIIFPEISEDNLSDKPEEQLPEETKMPDFEDFPPGLLDDDGIPKPEGEIPDDFNFDHETVEPIEPQTNENMFEDEEPKIEEKFDETNFDAELEEPTLDNQFEESKSENEFENNFDLPTEETNSQLNDDEEKVTYNFNEDGINILEGNLDDEIENPNINEEPEIESQPVENFDKEFLSDEELEAEENLKNLEMKKEEEINKASSTEDGHMTADQLMMINKAAQLVNSNIKLDDVLSNIVDVATNLTNADRGTLYLVDADKGELWSKVAMGDELKQIRLNLGEGIAGWVGQSGEIVNIEDVKSDSRFKSDYDKSSGYQTKTMLCFPIKNKEEEIVGVVQLLNSKNGKFSALDETFLSALSIHAALALENASLVEKLLQTERVSSLGKMANFLIQDIKKPVLVSKRYAEHLRSKEFPADIYQVIDMLMEQLNHVADIVQTTSSYSQGTSLLRTVNTSLNQLLDDYCGRIESLVTTRNCSIMKEYGEDVKVKVDIKEFNQCFSHIIKNACDAMPEGGTITLSTRKDGKNVKISFKDYGLGIPDTMKEKIFEPFMSHGKKEGTGLGLSITKKLIEDHGGSIDVISELGEGADFIVTLPIASAF